MDIYTATGIAEGWIEADDGDQIINVSSKGTLFNQFPARIYVDGKSTSAAKFAAL